MSAVYWFENTFDAIVFSRETLETASLHAVKLKRNWYMKHKIKFLFYGNIFKYLFFFVVVLHVWGNQKLIKKKKRVPFGCTRRDNMSSINDQQSFEYLAGIKILPFLSAIITIGKIFSLDNKIIILTILPFLIPFYLQNATCILIEYKKFKIVFKNIFSHRKRRRLK